MWPRKFGCDLHILKPWLCSDVTGKSFILELRGGCVWKNMSGEILVYNLRGVRIIELCIWPSNSIEQARQYRGWVKKNKKEFEQKIFSWRTVEILQQELLPTSAGSASQGALPRQCLAMPALVFIVSVWVSAVQAGLLPLLIPFTFQFLSNFRRINPFSFFLSGFQEMGENKKKTQNPRP